MNTKPKTSALAKREKIKILRDTSRVIARPLIPDDKERIQRLITNVLKFSPQQTQREFNKVKTSYGKRHKDLSKILRRHFEIVYNLVSVPSNLSETQQLLIGAYFTMEYSLESAALFNPSIIPHPDQSRVPKGSVRFIMSLRATGEGHISSIVFRCGVIRKNHSVTLDKGSHFAELPTIERRSSINDSNYTATFSKNQQLSERVLFPVLKNESKGIEDARFVCFCDDNGEKTYYATYTAYDGHSILPQFIATKDFLSFEIITLQGRAVQNKGMALFPRKVNGKYVMLSRQDGETNKIMFSDDLHRWDEAVQIQVAESPWEFVQIGNCGSPIETEYGWLVITHGVGSMRQYSIGAVLLDLNDPRKMIARLEEPLLTPNEQEREGYVPNVVYSCGSMLHDDTLILPYAMSDITTGIATVKVKKLISSMKKLV